MVGRGVGGESLPYQPTRFRCSASPSDDGQGGGIIEVYHKSILLTEMPIQQLVGLKCLYQMLGDYDRTVFCWCIAPLAAQQAPCWS